MKNKFYYIYKLPIWIFVLTMFSLIILISCHHATVNPPSIDLIRKSLKKDYNASFILNNEYSGQISNSKDLMTLKIEEPKNINGIEISSDYNNVKFSFDNISFDIDNSNLIANNKINLICNAINYIYLDDNMEISRLNDTVKIKFIYQNREYKVLLDKNLNITNIVSDGIDFKMNIA